ncbi:MAG TPA: hypothetical protein VGM73_04555 [Candidatus Didemnitutus sp.]|jgi:hypothetical protein
MSHLTFQLLRWAFLPVLYWIGFAATKTFSLGRAVVMPFSDYGEEEYAWYEFTVRESGIRYWLAETMVLIGGVTFLLVLAAAFWWRLS